MFVETPADSIFGGDLLIATAPNFGDLTQGCLERVRPGPTPTATCGIPNAMVGGYETHADVQTRGGLEILWLAVSTSFTSDDLRAFDLQTATLWSNTISGSGQLITDVAACPHGSVVATDAKMNAAGFRVYRDGTEVTTAPISFGLPPGFGNGLVCSER
jgi:hypothetical protein